MLTRHLFRLGLLVALLCRPALATTVDAPDIDSLIGQSDYIVRAVVKAATPTWREHAGRRFIKTRVELEVREVIKGAPPSPLVMDLLGGRIGDDELTVTGLPQFHVGDEQILFVHGAERKMFPLVALMHGVYPIIREARSGEAYVLRSNGQPLYSAQDVSLPMDQGRPMRTSIRPMTAGAFAQELRHRVGAQGKTREH